MLLSNSPNFAYYAKGITYCAEEITLYAPFFTNFFSKNATEHSTQLTIQQESTPATTVTAARLLRFPLSGWFVAIFRLRDKSDGRDACNLLNSDTTCA